MPFIVLALARSRTKWLSEFLSYGDWHCGHDELQHMRSLDDVQTWFKQPNIGSAETAAGPFWRLLLHYQPGIRIVVVRRPVKDVVASVLRVLPQCDRDSLTKAMCAADRKLEQIERRVPGVLSVRFDALRREATCAHVFEFCLGVPHDPDWWASWNVQHVSGNLAAQLRYCQAYLPQLTKLARAAKQRTLALMQRDAEPPDGFTFREESFDSCWRDAARLFKNHMVATGQDVDDYTRKNLPVLRRLDDAGALQIISARSNGRMFGYLISVISPSLDKADALEGHMLPIFASPDAPGLGMKLQRHAISQLRRKGVGAVYGRAGTRGSGPKLGIAFRRLGFEECGQLYRLEESP